MPINILDLDLNRVTVSATKKQEYGAMLYLGYDGQKYFPELVMPDLEVSTFKRFQSDKGLDYDTFMCFFSFNGMDEDSQRGRKLKAVRDKMLGLQERIQTLLVENVEEIKKAFPKGKYDAEKLRMQFTNVISAYTNEETGKTYPESFKVELQREMQDRSKFNAMRGKALLIDRHQNEIPVDIDNVDNEIKRGASLKAVLRIAYVFVGKTAVTVKLRMVHAVRTKVAPKQNTFTLQLDDDEFAAVEMEEERDQGLYEEVGKINVDYDM
ncbi:hypothetical protein BCR44DRAFT_401237 [Catenaria anguillulae PL171]|uniref:Uncharacterized protein n=1 Tax=Catenaria anguillulae PL171 TaxID=765915 RepID=A0A1Y2H7J8_9FUNG|nr:hypothetical protein BCR44DRAFT_401237 [Catenaria anguillulae PL171]